MTAKAISISLNASLDADRHDWLGLTLSAALPLAVFILLNGIAHFGNVTPMFFTPFGLPSWAGVALHLGSLPLFGVARWMVADRGRQGQRAGWWIVALMAGTIAFPFVVQMLDALALSIVAMGLFILGLGAMVRAARVSRTAALVMAPGLAWMGFSAFVGLAFASAWSPPFALTNSQS